jgi:hypothetical protein
MWAVKLSTALTTLPRFPGSDILDMIAQVRTECMSCPEGTMAVWVRSEGLLRSPRSEQKPFPDHG